MDATRLSRLSQGKVAVKPAEVETIVSEWVTGKILAEPNLTGGAHMSAVSIFFAPGMGHARHNHSESEQIIFVITGEAEMMIEDENGVPRTQIIRTGDLVYIPQGAYHSTFNVSWEPVRILAIYSPPGPETAMRESSEFKIYPPNEVPRSV